MHETEEGAIVCVQKRLEKKILTTPCSRNTPVVKHKNSNNGGGVGEKAVK